MTTAAHIRPQFRAVLVALRPRQWLKNLLVFAAPLAAGTAFEPTVFWLTIGAFVSFCLASSGTYLLNDLLDIEADRTHPTKRHRPIAAGDLRPSAAFVLAITLVALALALAWVCRPELAVVICVYVLASLCYSLGLKREPVIELAVLASGFLLRAVAGGVAADIRISQWFLIVAAFGSLFMAAGKRFCELKSAPSGANLNLATQRRSLAGYSLEYLRFVWGLAGAVTITAYCLWAFEVGAQPSTFPWAPWSVLPFVVALLRYALEIDRGSAEVPENLVLHDYVLLMCGLVWLILFGLGAMGI